MCVSNSFMLIFINLRISFLSPSRSHVCHLHLISKLMVQVQTQNTHPIQSMQYVCMSVCIMYVHNVSMNKCICMYECLSVSVCIVCKYMYIIYMYECMMYECMICMYVCM